MKTIQELNEYIALNFFNLKYDEHSKCWREEMAAYFRKGKAWVTTELPDYVENYQPVLEKLLLNDIKITIGQEYISKTYATTQKEIRYYCSINKEDVKAGYGNTTGEAICRAAVNYLESKKEKE